MPLNPIDTTGDIMLKQLGRAGVIRSEWALPHLLHRMPSPPSPARCMIHARLSLPDTEPLNIIAIYRPNSSGWRATRS